MALYAIALVEDPPLFRRVVEKARRPMFDQQERIEAIEADYVSFSLLVCGVEVASVLGSGEK